MRSHWLMTALLALPVVALPAQAEPYWVAYEANDGLYPEQVGWERHFGGGGAQRSFEDGALVIDSLADSMIFDFCQYDRPVDPGPGETFVATWCLEVTEHYGYWDPGVAVARDSGGILGLEYTDDAVRSPFEGWTVPITPGEPHTYRIESVDMVNYSFSIDGNFETYGTFYDSGVLFSYVAFGDAVQGGGARSLSKWDYFRFGVVPEPQSLLIAVAAFACVGRRRH